MSSSSGSGENADSLGIRRSVELPETEIGEAEDLTPTSETEQETTATSDESAGGAEEKAADTAPVATEKEAPRADTIRDIAVATPPNAAVAVEEMPPDRPKKTVLAGVAIGGAVVLAIPILLIGRGVHHGEKHRTVAAAATVQPGNGQQPGAFTSVSPTVTPSPSASAKPKKTKEKKAGPKGAAKHAAAAAAAKGGFGGVSDVLLKNAATGMCADVPGYGNGSKDGPVNQYHCALGDSDNQVWSLGVQQGLKGPAPLFVVRNNKDNLCMDLPYYGAAGAGTKVTEYYCEPTKTDNQLWYRSHTSGHLYRIRNYASHGLCLGVTGRSSAGADKQLEIHKCGSGDEWSFPSGS